MNIDKNILEIPIEDIIPNRFQPRLSFNEEGITELAESIKQHGIIQPLVVRKLGDKYEIIAGERRYKAATMAGLTKVPVIISNIDDNKSAEVALVENIQRRNLTAIEEAKSYKNLLDRGYLTQEQLANKMGVSQSSIANKLRLLNLDEEVQEALLNEKISERHARALLALEDKEEQKKWLKRIIDERLTVRQLDLELKKLQENGDSADSDEIKLVNINPNLDEIVSNAEDIVVQRAPHDVASMLIPEVQEEPKEEIKEEQETKPSNKFFNFLENEEANMSVIEPDEILDTFTTTSVMENPIESTVEEQPKEPVLNNDSPTINEEVTPIENPFTDTPMINTPQEENKVDSVELLDELDDEEDLQPMKPELNSFITEDIVNEIANEPDEEANDSAMANIFETPSTEPINNENTIVEETPSIDSVPVIEPTPIEEPVNTQQEETKTNEEEPFKSIFFNHEEEKPEEVVSPIEDNKIEEIEPTVEENIVDPLDSIVTLEPNYQQKQEELAGRDLKTAINTVRNTIKELENKGFLIETEEADLEDVYHITIKIDKDNK